MTTPSKTLAALARQEAAAKVALAQKKTQLAQRQAALRDAERKQFNRRCYTVGRLVLETPLADLEFERLQTLLVALGRCAQDPVRLQAFLREHRDPEGRIAQTIPGSEHVPSTGNPGNGVRS